MKVLIAGLGSIGQRHVRNLRKRFGHDLDIIAYRVRGLSHVITDRMTIADGAVERVYDIRCFDRLEDALGERPDAAFICNPTSLHLPTALAAARAGCHLFIEKPLADDLDGLTELIATVNEQRLVATVGYQLRFHPAVIQMRDLLRRGVIGAVMSATAQFVEHLADAHPYEDYRHSYAARAELGGGVILCFIHEVDYLCWLFGLPHRVSTSGGRWGDLEIDVEDTAITNFEFACGDRRLPVRLEQSFVRRPPARSCTIVGAAGRIHLDLLTPSIDIETRSGTTVVSFAGVARNQLFEAELDHFLAAINGDHPPAVSLDEAAGSLRVALAMRGSLARGQALELAS